MLVRVTQKELDSDTVSLRHLSLPVRLYVMLFPYISRRDMLRWWTAHMISRPAHRFKELYSATLSLLVTGTWQGCDLMTAVPMPPPDTVWAQPSCQCGTRPQLQVGASYLLRGGGDIRHPIMLPESVAFSSSRCEGEDKPNPWRRWGRPIRAAPWVARTLYTERRLVESGRLSNHMVQGPRFQAHPRSRGPCGQKTTPNLAKFPRSLLSPARKLRKG